MIDLIFVRFLFLFFGLVDEICQARIIPNDGLKSDLRESMGKIEERNTDFDTQRFENQRMLLNYVPVSQDEALGHARQRVYNPRSLTHFTHEIGRAHV